jgi:hypothetical protein
MSIDRDEIARLTEQYLWLAFNRETPAHPAARQTHPA